MKKRFLLLTSTIILLAFTIASDDDSVSWSSTRKLKWSDFKGKKRDNNGELAVTDYSISYSIHAFDNDLRIALKNGFSPNTSWAGDTIHKILLVHEQGHFDLAEVYARKMRKAIQGVSFKYDSVSVQFNKIYSKYYDDLNKEQDAYDEETEFSQSILGQKRWLIKIDSSLKSLDAYRDTVIKVTFVK